MDVSGRRGRALAHSLTVAGSHTVTRPNRRSAVGAWPLATYARQVLAVIPR